MKTIKLLAQSTGEFTRDELKKDARLSWTDKARAEIAAAKGTTSPSDGQQSGGTTPGGNSGNTGGNTGDNTGDNTGGGGNQGGGADPDDPENSED